MHSIVEELAIPVHTVSEASRQAAMEQWNRVAKPLNSLGKLETIVTQMSGIYETLDFDISKRAVLVFCADHGVVEEGVSQSTSEVTAMVAKSLVAGRSNVNILAQASKTRVIPVDMGIKYDANMEGIVSRRVNAGTKNFCNNPAMTRQECLQAIQTGIDLVGECKRGEHGEKAHILAIGEMGIGNTTSSSALACALLKLPAETMTGRGAGLSQTGLNKKMQVVQAAIDKYPSEDALELLASMGGFEIAAMTGACIGGMVHRVPIVLDGVISNVAALYAATLVPECRDYLIASHVSKEPAGQKIMDALGFDPIIHGEFCLGEGTGAVLLFPMLDAALLEFRTAHTFGEISLEPYQKQS